MIATIVGAAGYTGGELIRILSAHPSISQVVPVSASSAGKALTDIHPDLLMMAHHTFAEHVPDATDVLFLCQGHGASSQWLMTHPQPEDRLVVDLSADYRLDPSWTYGLPEASRSVIRSSRRIANPGCFATCIELGLLPLARAGVLTSSPVVTALTGSTGAGQKPTETTHFSWRSDNISVYKQFDHQHLSEIRTLLGVDDIVFTPMRGNWTRGIIASIIVTIPDGTHVRDILTSWYTDHPMTTVVDDLPDMKRVVGTSYAAIGVDQRGGTALIVSVIDNLLKGASGQAVQNMNLAMGLDETAGLIHRGRAY
ncbi:MAG: N-acetyl-gamma-glutamyl-phosphate reductase [Candidatus Kapabacteria bacterium]|nr:N-acetyl-gamma-glutamyl-phosphate reductase [Candidatus Kapabacteria bacterium]